MSNKSVLKQYMTSTQASKLGNLPTTHQNMMDKLGVARAGKTARDKAKRGE